MRDTPNPHGDAVLADAHTGARADRRLARQDPARVRMWHVLNRASGES
jgi:hypothetical protein